MPNEKSVPAQVRFTPEFKRNLRALSKKYRHIRSDVQPVTDQSQRKSLQVNQIFCRADTQNLEQFDDGHIIWFFLPSNGK
jgi:mRNA-degrading endonuclease RelE of RelBE toxin-antitoxin system